MAIVEYLALFGRRVAELLDITEMFQQEEAYGAFGMSIFIAIFGSTQISGVKRLQSHAEPGRASGN